MKEEDLRVFIQAAAHYFTEVGGEAPAIGTPYLMSEGKSVLLDFAAVIGISGGYRGCVYYTAPIELTRVLIRRIGETSDDHAFHADFVGEIANTISGNAQEELGANFMISPPVVLVGAPGDVRFPKETPAFVVPINWQNLVSNLIICITRA